MKIRRHARLHLLLLVSAYLSVSAPLPAASPPEQEAQAAEKDQETQSQAERLADARREKAKRLVPNRVDPLEARLRGWEKARFPARIFQKGYNGIRPVIGGMPSGSGFVFGAGYIRGLESERLKTQFNGRYSTRGFSQFDARVDLPPPQRGSRFSAALDAAYQDYTSLRFFGLGTNSNQEDKSFYAQQTSLAIGEVTWQPHRFVELTPRGGWMKIGTSTSERDPSAESVFPLAGLPGFGGGKTDFQVYGGRLALSFFDQYNWPPMGVRFTIEGLRYEDADLDLYDTTSVVVMVETQIPLKFANRRLAFRFRTAHYQADSGQQVPFFLMETLGGANTIRGFSEYRFRDTRNMLFNLEYRWEAWTYLDFAFFADAGKVFRDFDDFDLKRLYVGYGGGIRVHAPGPLFFSIDLAGSKEGFKLHVGSGVRF